MTVKAITSDVNSDHKDNTIVAVCIANYLNDRGLTNENYEVVRVLKDILSKLPEQTKINLIKTFKLDEHFKYFNS